MHFNFPDTALCLRVVETLLHFLWQGFAIGGVMWVLNALVPPGKSNLRYRLNLTALLLMAACVPLTFAVLPAQESADSRSTDAVPAIASSSSRRAEKETARPKPPQPALGSPQDDLPPISEKPGHATLDEADAPLVAADSSGDTSEANAVGPASHSRMSHIAPYATAVYAMGVIVMLLRLLLAVWGGQRLRRASQTIDDPGFLANVEQLARRLGMKVAPLVATCSRISGPVVVGLLRPMILLPPLLVSSMSPAQLEAVLAHELAHLRRFDLAINLLQRLIEAVLFFHPAVWYVSHRVSVERENSCDDLVVEHGCDRLTYADALLRMAEICASPSAQPALETATALAATGTHPSEFKTRVLRVVGESHGPPLRLTRWGLTLLTALLMSLTVLLWAMQSGVFKSSEINWASLDGMSYDRSDDKFVDVRYSGNHIIFVVITTPPEKAALSGGSGSGAVKQDRRGNMLYYSQWNWDSARLRTELESDHPTDFRFLWSGTSKGTIDRRFSLEDGRIFYCEASTGAIEQRKRLRGPLPQRPALGDSETSKKIADNIERVVQFIEAEFSPVGTNFDFSGPITDATFTDMVAEQVARLHYATSWQLDNARKFARQITRENLDSDLSETERREILEDLRDHVTQFVELHAGEQDESAYLNRPKDVRLLLWRLKHALSRKPLEPIEKEQLDSQFAEIQQWVRSVPSDPRFKITRDDVISRLEVRRSDLISPLFKSPLPTTLFREMMGALNEEKSEVHSAEHDIVADWFFTEIKSDPGFLQLLVGPPETIRSRGVGNGILHIDFPSTEVWRGSRTSMFQSWDDVIDLSESLPALRSFPIPDDVVRAGDDAVRKWYREQSHGLGHILFDFEKRRLVGVRGTRFIELDISSYLEADRLNADWFRKLLRDQNEEEFRLPEPKSADSIGDDLIYDLYVGAVTESNEFYVLKIEEVSTFSQSISYRVRLHHPPHPDEDAFAANHGSHDHAEGHEHDHSALTPEAQMKKVIGRFDPDYWQTVDVPRLIAEKQIAFSPDRECLALLRGQTLYAIESVSGQSQEYEMQETADLVEWKSGSIHVRTQGGEERFYAVRRPAIQFLDENGEPTSAERLMEARLGYSTPHSDWTMYSQPGRPLSLMGLQPGSHWLVTDSHDLFAVSMPLGSRDPNLPEEVMLQGEETERMTPSGTVRDVRRRLQPQPRIQVNNVSAKAVVAKLANGHERLLIEIQNNSGKRLQFSEQHIYLETEVKNKHERALSPNWTQENRDTKWSEITIEDGARGVMELDWIRWRDRGVWFGGFLVTSDTKELWPLEQTPGTLQVRVHGPGFRTRPVALSTPETEQAEPRGVPGETSDDGTDPPPIDATTLEL